jgi:hypothetical protein
MTVEQRRPVEANGVAEDVARDVEVHLGLVEVVGVELNRPDPDLEQVGMVLRKHAG